MHRYTNYLTGDSERLLRSLLGESFAWIHGKSFLVSGDLIASAELRLVGTNFEISFSCAWDETPAEYLDFARLTLRRDHSIRLTGALPLGDASLIALDPMPVKEVQVIEYSCKGDDEAIAFDAWVDLVFIDGQRVSIGSAPAAYGGACFRRGGPPEPPTGYQSRVRLSFLDDDGKATP